MKQATTPQLLPRMACIGNIKQPTLLNYDHIWRYCEIWIEQPVQLIIIQRPENG